uniref:Uncharacterized protein n=1 Tax=Glossina austeni TaxID=7395 RepID=A0A1A9VT81_GLOAU
MWTGVGLSKSELRLKLLKGSLNIGLISVEIAANSICNEPLNIFIIKVSAQLRYDVKNAITSPIALGADTMPFRRYANTNNNNNNKDVKEIFKANVEATRYDGNDGNELIYNRLNSDDNHNNNNNKRSPRNFNTLSSETRDQPFKWMPDSNQLIIEDYGSNDKQQTVNYGQREEEEEDKINENERKSKQQKQQQCLEYLGDSDKTMPKHLCNLKSPGELLSQLRQLRLKNCCERNVYSALHTLALNITLSGGNECEQLLNHIMELDALAARITCGLSNILYRFDCRQIYSIIHQCDDCKLRMHLKYLEIYVESHRGESVENRKLPRTLSVYFRQQSSESRRIGRNYFYTREKNLKKFRISKRIKRGEVNIVPVQHVSRKLYKIFQFPIVVLCNVITEVKVHADVLKKFGKTQAPDDLSAKRENWIYAYLNSQNKARLAKSLCSQNSQYGFIPKAYSRPPAVTNFQRLIVFGSNVNQ